MLQCGKAGNSQALAFLGSGFAFWGVEQLSRSAFWGREFWLFNGGLMRF
jgi:hypothetical protein